MTRLSDFLASRGPAEMYDTYWVPCLLDPFARDMAALASRGNHVLDIGCGTGLVTRYVADRVGRDGRTVGLDPTPFMLQRARTASTRYPTIEWMEGAAEKIPFPDESFDVVVSNQGWQYLTDRTAAFREMHRVLKPGGTLGGSVWSRPQGQKCNSVLEAGLAQHLGAQFVPIHAWTFGGLDALRVLAEDTGFTVRSLGQTRYHARFRSLEEYLYVTITSSGRTAEDGSMAMGMFDLDDATFEPKVEALIADLERELAEFVTADGFVFPYASDVLVATR
jgi:ubiquinone/menaquinone biosynthesis C-methylase UbiE